MTQKSTNIKWHDSTVSKEEREEKLGRCYRLVHRTERLGKSLVARAESALMVAILHLS